MQFAYCWAHARRKFFEFHHATGSPIAAEALRRIAELYQIEARIRAARSISSANTGFEVVPVQRNRPK